MHNQKTKRLSKKRKNKKKLVSDYDHYQKSNPLTVYFAKYIEKNPEVK